MPDLQEDLQALADRKAAESAGDFDSVLTAARSRKRRMTAGLTVLGAAVVVAAVAVVPTLRPAHNNAPVADSPVPTNMVAPPEVSVQPNPAPVEKAGPLTLTSAKALVSGGQFVASFPDKQVRHVTFTLASAAKPDVPLYTLVAKVPGDASTPYAIRMNGEMGISIPQYTGAGPYTLAMPKGLAAGSYQVCTLSGAKLCGLVTVK
ncbi:hypothetical protein EV645_2357 [Kribbella rubisoli]|jgi:hypothetical protein|uniref:Uncharacterized protein n=1 Tax=Kribbella rubisoli TaxID=3075929 RepID=A0A4Q7XA99_9ACTN|nr:hypothetical protein [Kribbella rubisoli]RZU20130.1 hypothetical protein EV645_2357 [Kribbella rubisoli]